MPSFQLLALFEPPPPAPQQGYDASCCGSRVHQSVAAVKLETFCSEPAPGGTAINMGAELGKLGACTWSWEVWLMRLLGEG